MRNLFARFRGSKTITPNLITPITTEMYLTACETLGIDPNALDETLNNLDLQPVHLPKMQAFLGCVCSNGSKIRLDKMPFNVAMEVCGVVFAFFLAERMKPSQSDIAALRIHLNELKGMPTK